MSTFTRPLLVAAVALFVGGLLLAVIQPGDLGGEDSTETAGPDPSVPIDQTSSTTGSTITGGGDGGPTSSVATPTTGGGVTGGPTSSSVSPTTAAGGTGGATTSTTATPPSTAAPSTTIVSNTPTPTTAGGSGLGAAGPAQVSGLDGLADTGGSAPLGGLGAAALTGVGIGLASLGRRRSPGPLNRAD